MTVYILIWTLTGLNLLAFITGIVTTAVLGSIKSLRGSMYPSLGSGGVTPQAEDASLLETNPPPFAPPPGRLRYSVQRGLPA
ncbi:hypothetical protein CRUP_036611 [Coryphaenoides rupestris]|nr:hypothetical protein CRUP_036611 [Coryphaenoides rupestris]